MPTEAKVFVSSSGSVVRGFSNSAQISHCVGSRKRRLHRSELLDRGEESFSDSASPANENRGGGSPPRQLLASSRRFGKRHAEPVVSAHRKMVQEITTYLRGWLGYFDDCQTPSVLQSLEQWLRRRLRSVVGKQWKRGRTRFRELRKRGVSKDLAAQTAGSPHGPWGLAQSPALTIALPNAYFAQLGLPTLTVRP